MSFSSNFEVKATLYFRVHDAELYGGLGTIGFAKQSFELIPGAKLEDLNDIMAVGCKSSMAAMFNVPPEKLEFRTAEEYERESEDEDDE